MKIDPYLHAVLVLKGADKEISEHNIAAVLKAAGAEADPARAKVLAEAVKGVNFEDLLKAAAAPLAVAAQAAAAPAQGGEKKKEKSAEDEKKSEEAAAEGLANLFG